MARQLTDANRLDGATAVVLGGTKGIGRAAALAYGAAGANVVVHGRDADAARGITDHLEQIGAPCRFVAGDLYDYSDITDVIAQGAAAFGRVDVVLASGGTGSPAGRLFADTDPEDLIIHYKNRVLHRLFAAHAAHRHMKQHGYGKIVLVTSDAGRTPTPAEAMIGSAAASLVFLTRTLGRELASSGVRINTVCTTLTKGTPGYERHERRLADDPDAVIVKAFRKLESNAAFGLPTVEDVAALALFLSVPASDKISGATMSVNGGVSFPG